MIAKVVLLCAVVAATQTTTLLNSGILAPGLLNSGILAPTLLNSGIVAPGLPLKGSPLLSSVATSSVVGIPGAITTDKRIITNNGIIAGAPLSHGIIAGAPLSHGIIGASPLLLSNGIVSPIGLKSASILGGPVILK